MFLWIRSLQDTGHLGSTCQFCDLFVADNDHALPFISIGQDNTTLVSTKHKATLLRSNNLVVKLNRFLAKTAPTVSICRSLV